MSEEEEEVRDGAGRAGALVLLHTLFKRAPFSLLTPSLPPPPIRPLISTPPTRCTREPTSTVYHTAKKQRPSSSLDDRLDGMQMGGTPHLPCGYNDLNSLDINTPLRGTVKSVDRSCGFFLTNL